MLNRVVLVGRLTKDPELRTTQSGVDVCNFTLAVNRIFKSKDGEQQADFINCIAFRKTAENVNNYLSKGSLAGVDGRLQSRSYENQEGRRVYVTEVICDNVQFLDPKNDNQSNTQQQQRGQAPAQDNPFANANGPIDISDDDLPF
ncbi:single-stranded DNA-binding protein [Staphylococcus pseudintermedius]|uniref:single-stranded DNA-binding protein n=1 Tax=Staphylococcus pseudintermedius TaxID=283734 RepID=UPI0019D8BA57|nr:single-stranded DNA-binding protein [Staphylococcus pseudintermedius]EGQ3902552.1 single-stranded DNA-binding protein [Staphylococcus pseudintermedius]EGQ3927883.1 single-stranded DNA-binding protein [Staphylococcus pseudintermedius]EGQ3935323.1 single-stranded DNA-binding protein [Staphylococcus pseudintermedius]EHT7951062.1 single-stranded DNA-binding protein [Staphylococcus pseudintermedius]EIQ4001348.1 single-stranded DNA-binding protein [Staphylococcus pseudintermedius]